MQALYDFIFEKPDIRKLKNELKQTVIFNTLDNTEISTLTKHLTLRQFKKGERVFFEGDPGAALFVILKGEVQISKLTGTKKAIFANLEKGMFFGELALAYNTPRTASAQVTQDALLVGLFKHDFEKIVKHYPMLGNKLLRIINNILGQRLSAVIDQL